MKRRLECFLIVFLFVLSVQLYLHMAKSTSSTPTIGGCQIFPANNIWNHDISNLPLHPKSANYIQALQTDQLQNDFGHPGFAGFPYVVVPGTQPKVPVHFYDASESDPGPYPIPPNAPIEGRADRHVLVLDSGTCKLYEIAPGVHQSDGSWRAESGAIFDLNSNRLRPDGWPSADAAGLPILPGLVRYDEVAAGVIKHALRGAIPITQDSYLWPARHTDGTSEDPNVPPEGLRLRLKSSVDISSFPSQSRVILTALKHYGMFVADRGGGDWHNIALSGAPGRRWEDSDLASLMRIHGSDFEAVDESSLQVSHDSTMVGSSWQFLTLRPTLGNLPVRSFSDIISNTSAYAARKRRAHGFQVI